MNTLKLVLLVTMAAGLIADGTTYSNQGGFPDGAVRLGDWKLVERYEDGRVHLYKLRDDEGEHRDLAAEQPQRVRDLRTRLHQWYRQVDAKFLQPKEGGPTPWRP
jgi:arylsulfatase A-like enzyme